MLKNQNIFEPEFTEKFIDDYILQGDKGRGTGVNYSGVVWSFYVFQDWYNTYING